MSKLTLEDWSNEQKIDLRTKVALKVLLLIFKVLSPYRFAHEFKKDLEQLEKDIYGLQNPYLLATPNRKDKEE